MNDTSMIDSPARYMGCDSLEFRWRGSRQFFNSGLFDHSGRFISKDLRMLNSTVDSFQLSHLRS